MSLRWFLSVLVITFMGCASNQLRPSRTIQRELATVDELVVGEHRVDDPEVISRLTDIHTRSKWDPVPITLPVGMLSIDGFDDGVRRFTLVYSSWLWETDDTGQLTRRATLTEADREWMEQTFRVLAPLPATVQ